MKRRGVDEVFFAGTPLADIVEFVKQRYAARRRQKISADRTQGETTDLTLAGALTLAETDSHHRRNVEIVNRKSKIVNRVIGLTGPGGAGKTTLIDERCCGCGLIHATDWRCLLTRRGGRARCSATARR
jgi:methylmalonyl-CoA mutase